MSNNSDRRIPFSYPTNPTHKQNYVGKFNVVTIDNTEKFTEHYSEIIEMFENDKYDEMLNLPYFVQDISTNEGLIYCITPSEMIVRSKYIVSITLLKYCLKNDDINMLRHLIQKEIFSCFPNLISRYVLNNVKIFGIIINSINFTQEDMTGYISNIINYNYETSLFVLLLDRGYKIRDGDFFTAIYYDRIDIVLSIIDNNYDIQSAFNSRNDLDRCPSLEMVKFLHNNIDITKHVNTMFQKASTSDLDVVMYLVESFPEIDLQNGLLYACNYNMLDIVKYLLKKGAIIQNNKLNRNVKFKIIKCLCDHDVQLDNEVLNTFLLKSFTCGQNLDDINYLIGKGADVSYIFYYDKTDKRITFDQKINALYGFKYDQLESPLECIVSLGKIHFIKFLVENYYNLMQPEIDRLFVIACANGQIDVAKYLDGLNATLDNKALIASCFFGHYDTVLYLTSLGLELKEDNDILRMTLSGSFYKSIASKEYDSLLENNIIFRNDAYNYGNTYHDICKLLFKYGITINDDSCVNILSRKFYDVELFSYFIDKLPDINKKYASAYNYGLDNSTLLESSIIYMKTDVIEFLLKNGANLDITNTAALKVINENEDIKNLLLTFGYIE
jgi:ankyrin repeat protein